VKQQYQAGWWDSFTRAWSAFWFSAIDPIGLHRLRVLTGILFICWLLPYAGRVEPFFGLEGWFDREAYHEASRLSRFPTADGEGGSILPVPLGWSVLYVCGNNTTLLNLAFWGSLGVFALFTLGIATRLTSIVTWVMVVSFTANPATSYDADFLLVLLAFYMMVGHLLLGQWNRRLTPLERLVGTHDRSMFAWLRKTKERNSPAPSYAANVTVRLMQVHLVLVMLGSFLSKTQMSDWWTGVAYWYPLHPPFESSVARARAYAEPAVFMLSLVQYLALGWQLAFPTFAWKRSCRWLLYGGLALGWVGSSFLLKQPLFGPIFLVWGLSYLTPDEWHDLDRRLRGLGEWARSRLRGATPAPDRAKVKVG